MSKAARAMLALIALSVVAVAPAHAGSTTATYVAGPFVKYSNTVRGDTYALGGMSFTPTSTTIRVKLEDLNGPGILMDFCQENGAQTGEVPGNCGGEGDDVTASICSTGASQAVTGSSAFKANAVINVFIAAVDPGQDCENVGTQGTITISWT